MDNTTISFQDLIAVNGTMNAHLLYQYGFTLATDADPNDSLYLESAFLDGTLYLVVPYSSTYNCSSLASVFSQEADNNTTTTGNISKQFATSARWAVAWTTRHGRRQGELVLVI